MSQQRKERLGDEIRDIVANCLVGGKLSDPRLEFVTITGVKLSADLQLASIYFRLIDESKQKETKKGLISAAGLFRTKLSEELEIRRVPNLRFFYDNSVEKGEKVDYLLEKIRKET
ncbi:MAG: 30S ribosome-binding factor RbfA [Proteobacteria bacterium]|nr:30S ribosome-binding factor RbfA [Pseudomonadota bacterium]